MRGEACTLDWAEGFGLPGLDGEVNASVVFNDGTGDALYVGGQFSIAGDIMPANIAKWDGTNWSPLGTWIGGGYSPSVSALTVFDDGGGPALYAGGGFTNASGVFARSVAKWDGTTWSALGPGLNNRVLALTVFDDGSGPALYAGGFFTTAGGVGVNRIAKWSPRSYGDVNGNGTVNLSDLFCVLNAFSDDFEDCGLADVDIEPCSGNGTINLQDLFAVLNAFSDIDPCCGK